MKPEKLKSPFKWVDRTVMVHDRVWYVPSHYTEYDKFSFPGWTHPEIFNNAKPIKVEYCSGNGAWIAERALREANSNWVAVEMKFKRARKIWSKVKNHQLDNLLVVCGEGHTVTQNYFPDSSVSEVFINFPDPWPKRRHAKNRIVQDAFIQQLHRILMPGGTLTLVTDDMDYSNNMIEILNACGGLNSRFAAPYFLTEWPHYGSSYFEQLWIEKGKQIRYHHYCKVT